MLRGFAFLIVLGLALPSVASPLRLRNQAIRVRVNGESKPGYQLRPEGPNGNIWKLRLELTDAQARFDVIDVTPNTPARTISLRANAGEVVFDGRFEGGHVYRIATATSSTFVYLQPPAVMQAPQQKGPAKVDFEPGEKALADDSGIEAAHKGSL